MKQNTNMTKCKKIQNTNMTKYKHEKYNNVSHVLTHTGNQSVGIDIQIFLQHLSSSWWLFLPSTVCYSRVITKSKPKLEAKMAIFSIVTTTLLMYYTVLM